jgi:hypothetical protein
MKPWWRLVLLGCFAGLLAPIVDAAEVLTNEAIVSMVKAGLSEDLIIMKITSSPNTFDLSTNNLVTLKQQGVSEAILKAMVQTEGQTQGTKKETAKETPAVPTPPYPGAPPPYPMPPPEVVQQYLQHLGPPAQLVLLRDGKLIEMDYVAGSLQQSVGNAFKRAFAMSLHHEASLIIQGDSAKFRIPEKVPVFRFLGNPEGRLALVSFVKDSERNIRYVVLYRKLGSTEWVTKPGGKGEEIAIDSKREQDGYYTITPKTDLPSGEYGVVLGYRTIYPFCVE